MSKNIEIGQSTGKMDAPAAAVGAVVLAASISTAYIVYGRKDLAA